MDDDRRARVEAIEDFAKILRELRQSVGNPPFREMSGRSKAISHTTLHDATKGNRLPSWETTVEFVKACGADPAAYRESWESSNRAVRLANAREPSPRADVSADGPPGGLAVSADRHTAHVAVAPQGPPTDQPVLPAPEVRRRVLLIRLGVATVAAAVGVGAVVLVMAVVRGSGSDEPGPNLSVSPPTAAPSVTVAPAATGCPVRPVNPPSAPPAHKGDAAAFIADVTLPDCTRVKPGETLTKVWRLRNTGSVLWKGYSLRRLDSTERADQCQTISLVPIKDTRPGEIVDIKTDITTPRKPGFCYVRFKMVDASGRVAFPGNRPVNFQIIVTG